MLMPQWQTNTPTRGGSPETSISGGYSFLRVSVLRCEASSSPASAAARAGLHHRLRDVLGAAGRATDEDARRASVLRGRNSSV